MKRLVLGALAAPALLFVLFTACGDDSGLQTPAEPVLTGDPPAWAAPEARANDLIKALFPPPTLRQEANGFFADLKAASVQGDVQAVGALLVELMALALEAHEAGDLSEPGEGLTVEEALAELFDVLLEVAGQEEVNFDPGVLDGSVDGAIAVVEPAPTDTTITTEEEFAGTTLPADAVDEPVVIAIQRRTDVDVEDCLPLPAGVAQFEGCYQFDVIPDQDFNDDVVVGVCLETGPDIDDLRLHKFRPEEPELGVKPLPTAAPTFLDCDDFTAVAMEGDAGVLTRLAAAGVDALARVFGPRPLRAAHTGAGGLTINFSTIGWAEDNLLAWDSDRDGNTVSIGGVPFTFPDIFTSSSDGGHVTNLTDQPDSVDQNPKWSPDGTRIAFSSAITGDLEVWLMDPDGSNRTQVTTVAGTDRVHSWHPGGDSLAISTFSTTGGLAVAIIAIDGSNRHVVIDSAGSPAWSPDGSRIAVEHNDPVTGQLEIFLVDPDGSNRVQLTSQGGARPSWSPDGTKIAFATGRDGNTEVYVMNADGSNQVNISNNPTFDSEPAWSGDGGRIAFETNRDGNVEIYVMDPDGGDPRRITNDAASDGNPDWIR